MKVPCPRNVFLDKEEKNARSFVRERANKKRISDYLQLKDKNMHILCRCIFESCKTFKGLRFKSLNLFHPTCFVHFCLQAWGWVRGEAEQCPMNNMPGIVSRIWEQYSVNQGDPMYFLWICCLLLVIGGAIDTDGDGCHLVGNRLRRQHTWPTHSLLPTGNNQDSLQYYGGRCRGWIPLKQLGCQWEKIEKAPNLVYTLLPSGNNH